MAMRRDTLRDPGWSPKMRRRLLHFLLALDLIQDGMCLRWKRIMVSRLRWRVKYPTLLLSCIHPMKALGQIEVQIRRDIIVRISTESILG